MTTPAKPGSSASHLAETLEERGRALPLSGPRTRVTQEVRQWAAAQNQTGLEEHELLAAYAAAAERAPADLRREFSDVARTDEGREALLLLLGRAGASDEVRLAALDALEPAVTAEEAPELARINTGQRPAVLPRALEVLAATASATALFALRKVFALRDDAAALAGDLSLELEDLLPEARAVRDSTLVRDDLDRRDLLLCVLALPVEGQRASAATELPRLVLSSAQALDEDLRAEAKLSGSLGRFHSRLRDELVNYVLLSETTDESLQARAIENLFRREDLHDVGAVVEALPDSALAIYADRALSRQNRRARPDRAALALHAVEDRDELRLKFVDAANDALDDTDQAVLVAATRMLSREVTQLDQNHRTRLLRAYEALEPDRQHLVGKDLDLRALDDEVSPSSDALVAWVRAVSAELAEGRAQYAVELWERTDWVPDEVARLTCAIEEVASSLNDATDLTGRSVSAAGSWIKKKRGRTATREAVRALDWPAVRQTALTRFATLVSALPSDQARVVLEELITPSNPPVLAAAAGVELDADSEARYLLPTLARVHQQTPEAAEGAFETANALGRRRLIGGAALALRDLEIRIVRLEDASRTGASEALRNQRATVLASLTEAEEAAQGNQRLLELLAAIRDAVGTTEPNGSDDTDAGTAGAVPEAVRAWRLSAAERFAGFVTAPADGCQTLRVSGDLIEKSEDVASLMLELDKRATSARIAPTHDRAFYAGDLAALLDAVVVNGVLDALAERGEPTAIASLFQQRPSLASQAWERRADHPDGPGAPQPKPNVLASELVGAAHGDDRSQVELRRALAEVDAPVALQLARDVPEQEHEVVWQYLTNSVRTTGRRAAQLEGEVRGQARTAGAQIAEKLDLPFKVIERVMLGYFRLRNRLADAGWKTVEDQLGTRLTRERLDPAQHQVEGDKDADEFEVTGLGIRMGSDVLHKAVVRGIQFETRDED